MATLSLSAHSEFITFILKPDSVHRDEEEQAQQVVVTPVTADRTAASKQHNAD